MQEFDIWSWQTFIQSSTIESCTNLPALNSLSKCNLAMLKGRYQRGLILNDGAFITSKENSKAHWLGTHNMRACTLAFWTFESDFYEVVEQFDQQLHFFKLSASQLSSSFLTTMYKMNFLSFEHPRSSRFCDTYHKEGEMHGNIILVFWCMLNQPLSQGHRPQFSLSNDSTINLRGARFYCIFHDRYHEPKSKPWPHDFDK